MANNINVRDATGATTTVQTTDNSTVHLPAHQLRDSTGANALSVSAAGAAKVDGSAVTQPVSGTVAVSAVGGTVAATQSGTWNVGTVTTVTTVAAVTAISNALPAGNNNIGDVDVASIAAGDNNIGNVDIASIAAGDNNIGNVDVVTLPALAAGTNLIGSVAAANVTGAVYQGTTARTPVFAAIAASGSGNNTIVAADGSLKIRVLAVQLISSGTVNAKWQSGASGTDLTGLAYLVVNSGYVLPYNPAGWFETAAATLLNLNLSGAIPVGGSLTYILVS